MCFLTLVLPLSYTLNCFLQGRRELQAYDAQRLLNSMNEDMMQHQNSNMPDGATSGGNVAWAQLDDQYDDDDDDEVAIARRSAKRNTNSVHHSNVITPRATTLPQVSLQSSAVSDPTPAVNEDGMYTMFNVVVLHHRTSHHVVCKQTSCCCQKRYRIVKQKNTTILTLFDAFIIM